MALIYPRMYSLLDMQDNVGIRDDKGRLPMPILLQLSSEKLSRSGIFLLGSAVKLMLYVGPNAPEDSIMQMFGCRIAELEPEYVRRYAWLVLILFLSRFHIYSKTHVFQRALVQSEKETSTAASGTLLAACAASTADTFLSMSSRTPLPCGRGFLKPWYDFAFVSRHDILLSYCSF